VQGGPLDCQVDYLQLCHNADLFDLFPEGDFWPEDREVIQHADGVFLEKIGSLVPIYAVPVKIGENRKVSVSLNTGGERLELLLEIRRLEQLLAETNGLLAVLRTRREDCLRYRIVDKLNEAFQRVPALHQLGKKLVLTSWQLWQRAARQSA
jgi:hypothetical protein